MIPHPSHRPPASARVFLTGAPGTAALAEHVLSTGHGRWWTDRADRPRVVAVTCGGHALLAGDPSAIAPDELSPLARHRIETPGRFVPVLGAAFERLVPCERMLYVHRGPAIAPRLPRGVTVRRITPEDASALAAPAPAMALIHESWDGPGALAASGLGWIATRRGRVLAVACSRFVGSRYEDVVCVTAPDERRQHLALACVTGLTADIAARGHRAGWSCSRDNRPSRLLAWTAGFRLTREYVHHVAGPVSQASKVAEAA
ncbi:GNAT family N-acetyltransferase [Streptomyces sp. NPDC048590]|uniref:GNAT family N-acetyltransferase n=1 Tax=Streptomyces sp. NPDC048590 TaxID=3365574 RepID=UPI00371146F5